MAERSWSEAPLMNNFSRRPLVNSAGIMASPLGRDARGYESQFEALNQESRIPLLRATNGEALPGNPLSRVVVSSTGTNWHNLIVEELHVSKGELDDVMYTQHVVAVNVGRPATFELAKDGRC